METGLHKPCLDGDGHVHIGAVAFGRFFVVRGCEVTAHMAIRFDGVGSGRENAPREIFATLTRRGIALERLALGAKERVVEHEHHARPEVVYQRRAPGASLCNNPDCELSGHYAHLGPCIPCGCPREHAIDECPERPDRYEASYRLFVGEDGSKLHVLRVQVARAEEKHPGCRWTVGTDCAVAWIGADPVAFVMACRDPLATASLERTLAEVG